MVMTRTGDHDGDTDVAEIQTLSIASLHGRHRDLLTQAIANVLSTPVAGTTYGQIIDGLPLSSVAFDSHHRVTCPGHPLLDEHFELSPNVLERVSQLRASFDPNILRLNSKLVYAYRAASPRSRAFQTRLVELVAIAIHQIAVSLFKIGPIRSKDDPLLSWRPDKDLDCYYPDGPPPTFLRHSWYQDYDLYPEGVADGVGYWAEARILGGVVLFDRREPGSTPDAEPDAIYFHSDNREVTYRIYRLTGSQKQRLIQFLLSDTLLSISPIPIHGNVHNRKRVDPEEPMKETGIYRDKWERKALSADSYDERLRDVIDDFNYVSREEFFDARGRAIELRHRRLLGEYLGW